MEFSLFVNVNLIKFKENIKRNRAAWLPKPTVFRNHERNCSHVKLVPPLQISEERNFSVQKLIKSGFKALINKENVKTILF